MVEAFTVEPIRVLVVGDSGRLRHLLAVHDDIEVVGTTRDAETARSVAAEHYPDVVVVDLHGPVEPVGATAAITRTVRTAQVVVLDADADEPSVFDAVRAGAVGHLPASAAPGDIVEAVRAVRAGGCHLSARLGA